MTTSNTEGTVSLLIGNGDGTFQESISFDVGAGPRALTVTDFNGDGLSDVAVATVTDVSVLLGTTQGFLTPAVRYGTFVGRERITVGDFTNDGKLDILTVGQALEVFPGNGDGTFAESSVVYLSGAKGAVVAADFDGNGNLDAAVVSDNNEIRIYHGRGNGKFYLH